MRRGAKPRKAKVEAKLPVARKSRNQASKVRDLEKRLAEAQKREVEALEQQAATAEILRVISQSQSDVQPVFDTIVHSAKRLLGALTAAVTRLTGDELHLAALTRTDESADAELQRFYPQPVSGASAHARAVRTLAPVNIGDTETDSQISAAGRNVARVRGYRSMLVVPIVRDETAVGTLSLTRAQPGLFTLAEVGLLQTFADQAVIAIENVRLFTELKEKNRALTQAHAQVSEALEQQTATSEILRVISSSPTDVQPVFDGIVRSAARLCEATFAALHRFDGQMLSFEAHHGMTEPEVEESHRRFPHPPTRETAVGRAILDRQTAHIHDIRSDLEYRVTAGQMTFRTVLAVPLLREGKPLGAMGLWRREVQPFTDSQIELVKTFADQAVIAIENVRLFTELQSSNRNLTTALDQQTATSEVLRTIAQTKTDPQPVFDAIVRSAAQLCRAHTAAVFLTDGERIYHPAAYGDSPEVLAAIKARFPRPLDGETAAGTAILSRSVIHVPDVEEPCVVEFARQTGRVIGFRSLLSMPMLRRGEAVGAINVTRREPGPFSDAEVALLKTFADQAVIAVENVRLFKELEGANRELSAASQHKSEFLANMSHELRTPLNAIIGFSEVLTERMFGELNEKQVEYLKDIYASGQHLLSLINDILDLSKIEAGRMELELTEFDLPQAISNALTLVRERAGRRGIAMHHAVDTRLGQIRGDERKIKQVLLNLLSNALKFTPEGGRVEVRADIVDRMAEISVTDTGVGIAPEDQETVFEEFRQVGTAAKKVEGTGLGLALSRRFIELHGGKIWVKSQLGAGAIFTFTLPLTINQRRPTG
jgi:signal transduction histidine kinase